MSYLCSLWLFPRCPTHCSVFVFLFCLSSSSVPRICCQFFVVHFWLPLLYSSFIHSLVLETKWDTRAWHSSDTWHPFSSLPSEGEIYLFLYFVFSDRATIFFYRQGHAVKVWFENGSIYGFWLPFGKFKLFFREW